MRERLITLVAGKRLLSIMDLMCVFRLLGQRKSCHIVSNTSSQYAFTCVSLGFLGTEIDVSHKLQENDLSPVCVG